MRAYTCSGQSPRARHSGVGSQMGSQVGTPLNKTRGCTGIPVELFKTLKDDAIKCCIQYVSESGRSSSGPGLEEVSLHPNSQEN